VILLLSVLWWTVHDSPLHADYIQLLSLVAMCLAGYGNRSKKSNNRARVPSVSETPLSSSHCGQAASAETAVSIDEDEDEDDVSGLGSEDDESG
jgi:hypothetical protein